MSPKWLPLLIAPALLAIACGGGGSSPMPSPTPAVVAQPSATPEPSAERTPSAEPVETLAFLRDGDIWLINADGTGERQLTDLGDVRSFSWVSSTEVDAVTGEDHSRHLLVDLAGNVRELRFPPGGSWSQDGSLYAVSLDQQIVAYDREGGEVARLDAGPDANECPPPSSSYPPPIPPRLSFGSPEFLPDGEAVLVAVHCYLQSGVYNFYGSIYRAALDGMATTQLPDPEREPQLNLRGLVGPLFSPDGQRIAWAFADGFSLCPVGRGLIAADADGANRRGLSPAALADLYDQDPRPETAGGVTGFAWSPSSNAIVVGFEVILCGEDQASVDPVVAGIYLFNLDGATEQRLIEGQAHSPDWSPSGRLVAYVAGNFFGERRRAPVIRLLDLTTREVIDLAEGSQPAWQAQP